MTDEQINTAIAKACPDKFRNEDDVWFFQYDKDCWSQCHNNSICTDLNAMREAEKVLTHDQNIRYQAHMYDMSRELELMERIWMPYSANARYRAEAFLRSIGKWNKVEK